MKKEFLIFITGIIVGISLFYLIKSDEPATKTTTTKTQQIKIIPYRATPTEKSKTAIETTSNIEATKPNINEAPKIQDNTSISDKPVDKIRSDLIEQIQDLPDNKVKWVKEIVDQAEKPPVDKLFENEFRDPDKAVGLEDKLRYGFYEQNALNGKGRIDSLECRSRYCKARIALPSDDKQNGARNLVTSFPGVVLTNFNKNTDENSDENFTDVYIDTQPDSTMTIKFDDGNNP